MDPAFVITQRRDRTQVDHFNLLERETGLELPKLLDLASVSEAKAEKFCGSRRKAGPHAS